MLVACPLTASCFAHLMPRGPSLISPWFYHILSFHSAMPKACQDHMKSSVEPVRNCWKNAGGLGLHPASTCHGQGFNHTEGPDSDSFQRPPSCWRSVSFSFFCSLRTVVQGPCEAYWDEPWNWDGWLRVSYTAWIHKSKVPFDEAPTKFAGIKFSDWCSPGLFDLSLCMCEHKKSSFYWKAFQAMMYTRHIYRIDK